MDTIEKALKKYKQAQPGQENNDLVEPALDANAAPVVQSAPERLPDQASLHEVASVQQGKSKQRIDIDFDRFRELGIVLPDQKRSRIKEEYKHIKQPLLQRVPMEPIPGDKSNIIMVTSAYSGEGKTFSALNLAMSIAVERDKRVLLVDTDVVKPGLARVLGLQEHEGLVEYLNGDIAQLSDVLLSTNVNNLSVLLAGKTHHLSHELLASNAMRDLVDELASRYADRIVIFDSPPILMTSEAKLLSQLVGQIVMVVEQDKTSQSAIEDALAIVDKSRVTGLILNKAKASGAYYGYYYGEYQA